MMPRPFLILLLFHLVWGVKGIVVGPHVVDFLLDYFGIRQIHPCCCFVVVFRIDCFVALDQNFRQSHFYCLLILCPHFVFVALGAGEVVFPDTTY